MNIEIPDDEVLDLLNDLRGAAASMHAFPKSRDRVLELVENIEAVRREEQA